jgi:hypothetical protein
MEVSGQLHTLADLPPRERVPGNRWIGGWVGPRAVVDAIVKRKIHIYCFSGSNNSASQYDRGKIVKFKFKFPSIILYICHDIWVRFITAWRVLLLRMEESASKYGGYLRIY